MGSASWQCYAFSSKSNVDRKRPVWLAFTKKGKEQVKQENRDRNKGDTKCAGCGRDTVPAEQSKKGVTPPENETHVDHIDPKSKGGSGTPDNGQVLCRKCNLDKGCC